MFVEMLQKYLFFCSRWLYQILKRQIFLEHSNKYLALLILLELFNWPIRKMDSEFGSVIGQPVSNRRKKFLSLYVTWQAVHESLLIKSLAELF